MIAQNSQSSDRGERLESFLAATPQAPIPRLEPLPTPNPVRVECVEEKFAWINGVSTQQQQIDRITKIDLWSVTVSGGDFGAARPKVTIPSVARPGVVAGDFASLTGTRVCFPDDPNSKPYFIAVAIERVGGPDPLGALLGDA